MKLFFYRERLESANEERLFYWTKSKLWYVQRNNLRVLKEEDRIEFLLTYFAELTSSLYEQAQKRR